MPYESRQDLAKRLYGVTINTLEACPENCLKFLRGVATNIAIRGALSKRGYSNAVHQEGVKLLDACVGITTLDRPQEYQSSVIDAIQAVDPHDEIILETIAASLALRFPAQSEYLVKGLQPTTGIGAVFNVNSLLTRMDGLANDPERKATRKQDLAALELLSTRGITPELRAELAALIKVARSAEDVVPPDEKAIADADERHVTNLGELYVWYNEWSRLAKLAIKRRDHLIALGLASPKQSVDAEPSDAKPIQDE